MPFLHEVTLQWDFNGELGYNVFHVADPTESTGFAVIADIFRVHYWDILKGQIHDTTELRDITVKTLSGGAIVGDYVLPVGEVGDFGSGGAYHQGVHAYVSLTSDDTLFRAGGKMVGGWSEANILDGQLTFAASAVLQLAFDNIIFELSVAIYPLAILRSVLSVPGVPVWSEAISALIRGNGTNNRRQPAYV